MSKNDPKNLMRHSLKSTRTDQKAAIIDLQVASTDLVAARTGLQAARADLRAERTDLHAVRTDQQALKGQSREIFYLCFFSSNIFPWTTISLLKGFLHEILNLPTEFDFNDMAESKQFP
jgi:hypothetical protein